LCAWVKSSGCAYGCGGPTTASRCQVTAYPPTPRAAAKRAATVRDVRTLASCLAHARVYRSCGMAPPPPRIVVVGGSCSAVVTAQVAPHCRGSARTRHSASRGDRP
jgi:hypothetical protein